MEKHLLSKSTFIRGVQCLKSLYLYKNRYFLRDVLSAEQRAKFVRGIDVGILAQTLFPGGVNCQPASPSHYQKSVLKTNEIIRDGIAETIYEAAFQQDKVLILLDILARVNGRWNAYEIKSSRSVSETFVLDAALQYYVLKNADFGIDRFFLVHLNGDYEFRGKLEISKLFTFVDVTDQVITLQDFIIQKIEEEKAVITRKNSPKIEIGRHCNHPYPCDFIGHCWKEVPQNSIFDLSTFSEEQKFDLFNRGILRPEEISENMMAGFDVAQRIEITAIEEQKPYFDFEKLRLFLSERSEKSGFLWFPGNRPAVPAHEKFKPYDVVPVSAGFRSLQSGPAHSAFWFNENQDDHFDGTLIDFLEKWTFSNEKLFMYQAGHFQEYLHRLIQRKPEMAEKAGKLLSKITDLSQVFSERYFIHPALNGNFDLIHIAGKLLEANFSKTATLKNEVLAINEFLKFQVPKNDSDRKMIKDNIIDYGRLWLDCLEGFFQYLVNEITPE